MMSYLLKKYYLLLTMGFAGCSSLLNDPPVTYTYKAPEQIADGWTVASLSSQQMNPKPIEQLTDQIVSEQYRNIHSLLIVRNGKLVYENYFNGYSDLIPENIYSATKTFTSALIGIALDQKLIKSLDEKVVDYFPQESPLPNLTPAKQQITIRDLLTMSSGLECADDDPQSPGNEAKMYQSTDWIRYTLSLPMKTTPGTESNYCTGGVAVLGGILQRATGKTVDEFAQENLWKPLNITPIRWDRMPTGQVNTSGRMFIRPRDMAKLGQLFLNKGQWEGKQIISADWVNESTRKQVILRDQGYGYLWWRREFNYNNKMYPAYYASGNGGNFIVVLPTENLVVVSTAGNLNSGIGAQIFGMIRFQIITALL
ncbi:serine hydrolase domain-containing protein [Larkinella rosea]|uniref:Class C beta-lactamase-related serine hydrolase n=1 Tax=Larkinella rosea TaxID=2025312 RepID=A0A3P1C234_9BACT|nr:serine hydrolase [Larkinella rosea]RRB07367.1 class C beta-lactamase-related serine hydrolase [Larkinella rosea]